MQTRAERPGDRPGALFVLLALAVLVACGTWLRVGLTRNDPGFRNSPAEGLWRSDPALLAYFTQRIEESGGIPPDFRADPRLEHPETTDVPELFPVGPEFLVAALHQLLGRERPLHEVCLLASSSSASTIVVGAYLIGLALTRRRWLGLAAALFSALIPANYRTLGFLFVGEDWSLPFLALHLGLLGLALERPGYARGLGAALALFVALCTWHAASFFLALEALALLAWFWFSGRNALADRRALAAALLLAAGSLCVPVLRHTLFLLSLPMQILAGLAVAALIARRGGSRGAQRLGLIAAAGILSGLSLAVTRLGTAGVGEYSHVFALLWHKLVNFGQLPPDPAALPFEVRLMWQGPFASLAPLQLVVLLGLGSLGCVWAAQAWIRPSARAALGDGQAVASLLLLLSLPFACLIERTAVLAGLLCAPLAVAAAARLAARARALALGSLLPAQTLLLAAHFEGYRIPWYQPLVRQQELAALIRALPGCVPAGEAIAADFVNGTALLLHTRHPILLQPKWEVRRSRARIERFLTSFFLEGADELHRVLLEEFHCRYLLVDRAQLVLGCRYAADLGAGREPAPGSAAQLLGSPDPAACASVPGFRLVYRSPDSLRQENGRPADFYRLYELVPAAR